MIIFNTDGMVVQRFPFPAPVMDYILKNLKPHHLIKLYKCCKFFYAKYRQNIIQRLAIVDDGEPETFDPFSTTICVSNAALSKLKDFLITESFFYQPSHGVVRIPRFSQCTIKKLEVLKCIFWKDFEILTKAETVEELKIDGIVYFALAAFAPIEDIIQRVPNATSIQIDKSVFTPTTCSSLISMNRKAKISNLILHGITHIEYCSLNLFRIFYFKGTSIDCNVDFGFELYDGENEVVEELNQLLKERGILFKELFAVLKNFRKKKLSVIR